MLVCLTRAALVTTFTRPREDGYGVRSCFGSDSSQRGERTMYAQL